MLTGKGVTAWRRALARLTCTTTTRTTRESSPAAPLPGPVTTELVHALAWHHAGLITGHPYNDKGQCLYPPPGPNPPTRAQGRKLSERRPAAPAHDA